MHVDIRGVRPNDEHGRMVFHSAASLALPESSGFVLGVHVLIRNTRRAGSGPHPEQVPRVSRAGGARLGHPDR